MLFLSDSHLGSRPDQGTLKHKRTLPFGPRHSWGSSKQVAGVAQCPRDPKGKIETSQPVDMVAKPSVATPPAPLCTQRQDMSATIQMSPSKVAIDGWFLLKLPRRFQKRQLLEKGGGLFCSSTAL